MVWEILFIKFSDASSRSMMSPIKMKHATKIIILVLIFRFSFAFGQEADTLNVYFQALKLHLDYWDNFQNKRPDLVEIPDVYFVEQNDYTVDSLPKTINGYKIEVLNRKDLFEKTRKEEISLISIRPALWDKGRLVIYVIDFSVSRKRENYFYLNRGGSSFEIVGGENGNLELKIIHQGGI